MHLLAPSIRTVHDLNLRQTKENPPFAELKGWKAKLNFTGTRMHLDYSCLVALQCTHTITSLGTLQDKSVSVTLISRAPWFLPSGFDIMNGLRNVAISR